MRDDPSDRATEFLSSARRAFRASAGSVALDRLGWWELLSDLDDPVVRQAAFVAFRAHGRELATSGALGGLLAQPYLEAIGADVGTISATISRGSARRGEVTLLAGEPVAGQLLIDRPGHGVALVALGTVELRPVLVAGRLPLHEVDVHPDRLTAVIPERDAEPLRARSQFLGRIASSLEMLGAAEGALALALAHAVDREQFGQPIGTFQAVRHLLAWAKTECEAVSAVADEAVALDRAAPPRFDAVVKGLAGRNTRRVCERALQVLGAIGFTSEHDHHHFHLSLIHI